jgi:Fe-S cluster assembly protein SufD
VQLAPGLYDPREPGTGRAAPAQAFIPDVPVIDIADGCARVDVELPPGVRVLGLSDGLRQSEELLRPMLEATQLSGRDRALEALNTAQLEQGLLVHVAAGVDAGRLLLRWAGTGGTRVFNQFRLVIALEKGARLHLLEQHQDESDRPQLLNLVTQITLASGAEMQHLRLQRESEESVLLTSAAVEQGEASAYRYFAFDLGSGLVRHEHRVELTGETATTSLNGAYVLYGQRHADNHVSVHHGAANCRSEQFYRGVLGGRSRGVFNGRTLIREGADGSSVQQSNANLLLSRHAEIDTKPELEIYADEVEASHGATVGQLDESAVFYLRTRGLGDIEARGMLTAAFCRAVSDRLQDADLSEALSDQLDQAMRLLQQDAA